MALNRVWIPSPNFSSRGGTKVRLIVVHTAEGATTYQSLGNFFASPSSGVSSQTGIDDTPNTVGEYVRRSDKPWTQANANPYSTATELCAFAKWNAAEWNRHPTMLSNTAQWIREEAAHFGIPLVKLNASQAQGGQAGVCGHVDLGASGGGHWDPGPDFPWAQVMQMASSGSVAPKPPEPTPEPKKEEDMALIAPAFKFNNMLHVFYVTKSFGELWHKWSSDNGVNWHSESLMGAGGAKQGYVQTPKLVEVQAPLPDSDVCCVTVFDEQNAAWICRQDKGSSNWDRRKL